LSEVVVEGPAQTGSHDGERARGHRNPTGRRPREQDPARDDQGHPERDPPIEALPEYKPRQGDREDSLEVEEERDHRRRSGPESPHEQNRGHHAAQEDGAGEPREVSRGETRFGAAHVRQQAQDEQPESRTAVEESGDEHGGRIDEEQLGARDAQAEEHSGGQRKCDSTP
jgi:hypothetical protein